jgi:hypothetical protein
VPPRGTPARGSSSRLPGSSRRSSTNAGEPRTGRSGYSGAEASVRPSTPDAERPAELAKNRRSGTLRDGGGDVRGTVRMRASNGSVSLISGEVGRSPRRSTTYR